MYCVCVCMYVCKDVVKVHACMHFIQMCVCMSVCECVHIIYAYTCVFSRYVCVCVACHRCTLVQIHVSVKSCICVRI